jgi:hypothetical protein
MYGDVAIGALGFAGKPRRRVKPGHFNMTGVTKIGDVLVKKHVPVHRAVRLVALRASLDTHGKMLIQEGTLLIRVAFVAHLLLEPAELAPVGGAVLVMTVNASDHSLEHAMPLIQQ